MFIIINCLFLFFNVVLAVTLFMMTNRIHKSHTEFIVSINRIIDELKVISTSVLR